MFYFVEHFSRPINCNNCLGGQACNRHFRGFGNLEIVHDCGLVLNGERRALGIVSIRTTFRNSQNLCFLLLQTAALIAALIDALIDACRDCGVVFGVCGVVSRIDKRICAL